ncbi:MAG: hypothetical protein ACLUOF_02060 [Ruminococcus sp.]
MLMMIAAELFGITGAPYYLLAIAVSYLLSGYYGLYEGRPSWRPNLPAAM